MESFLNEVAYTKRGNLIQKTRKFLEWTQAQLAESIGVTVSTISRLEQGIGVIQNFEKAEQVLKISKEDIELLESSLNCVFTVSHWAAPIILLSQSEHFRKISSNFKLACTAERDSNNIIWSNSEAGLSSISGSDCIILTEDVKDLLRNGICDMGFVASTLPTHDKKEPIDEDFFRILSIVTVVRGGIKLTVIGRGDQKSIESNLRKHKSETDINLRFFYANSKIEELIFDMNFSNKGYDAMPLNGKSYVEIYENLSTAVDNAIQSTKDYFVIIAGSFVTGILQNVYNEKKGTNGEEFKCWDFNVEYEWWGGTSKKDDHFSKLYFRTYDLIIRKDSSTIERLYKNKYFKIFIEQLKESIDELNIHTKLNTESNTTFKSNRVVAKFLNLDRDLVTKYMNSVYYEMSFYPEWVMHNWH